MTKQNDQVACTLDIHDIEYLVCHVAMLWRRMLGNRIKALGVNITEKRILFCIARFPGLTQVQIATQLDLEPQNLLRSLDRMEKQGWIIRQADPSDRRVKCICITPEAKQLMKKIIEVGDEIKPQILASLNNTERQAIVASLTTIRVNLLDLLKDDI